MPERQQSESKSLGPLTLNGDKLAHLAELTRETYLADSRPWVIGYSGGKDSTVILQLVYYALLELPAEKLTKPIYVISGDTLVEAPAIVERIRTTHRRIREVARTQAMPLKTEVVRPVLDDTFWVNLIGRGYPAPYQKFRWCTDRMKIQPANLFITTTVAQFGEVVLVLGVRRAESATRGQVMSLHKRHGEALSRHSELPSAWVYTPIEDWTTNDVWTYLLQQPSPWGDNNRDLVALYRNADGECPLVVDTNTPSCGNSRFGCWVCTVVSRDRSMEAMIDSGEDWMLPMLRFRDELAETQDPDKKKNIRDYRRRDGRVHLWGEKKDKLIWGPYKLSFRRTLLRKLLQAQQEVLRDGPEGTPALITMGELEVIRRLWRVEAGDWEDSVPRIWQKEVKTSYGWTRDDVAAGSGRESGVLKTVAKKHGLDPRLLTELIDYERRTTGLHRRSKVNEQIDKIFKKDWRSEQEVMSSLATAGDSALKKGDDSENQGAS